MIPDNADIKAYRDAYAIRKTNHDIGYIEGYVESFAESYVKTTGQNKDKGKFLAAHILLAKGYNARLISYATGIELK